MHPNGTLYCSPFDGARVYSRGFYQRIVHHTAWTPDGTYRQHDKLANAWVHPDHDGMVVWMPRTGMCVVLARPKMNADLQPARTLTARDQPGASASQTPPSRNP